MTLGKIIRFGNPLLREQSLEIKNVNSQESIRLKNQLKDNLLHLQKIHKKGGGLAAPQLGHLKKLIYINAKNRNFFLFNPIITRKSQKLFDVWDFCFSSDACFLAKIKRHQKIEVEYIDETGERKNENFEGYWSELLQHEIDHLNGVLFIDHIKNPGSIMMAEEWDKQFTYKQGYTIRAF